jgi:hypothetical protein
MNANANATQHPVYTQAYIRSIPCMGCNKKTKTNRHLEFNNKDGTPWVINGEPLVVCAPCLSELMNKQRKS